MSELEKSERLYSILSKAFWFMSGVLVGSILTITRIIQGLINQ